MKCCGVLVILSPNPQSILLSIHRGSSRASSLELIEKFDIPINEYIRQCEDQISKWEAQEAALLGDHSLQCESPLSMPRAS